jgi:hypothetical protein
LDAEVASVSEQLNKVTAELLGSAPPSGERLQLLKDEKQRVVEKEKMLNVRRAALEAKLGTSALAPLPAFGPAVALLRHAGVLCSLCSFALAVLGPCLECGQQASACHLWRTHFSRVPAACLWFLWLWEKHRLCNTAFLLLVSSSVALVPPLALCEHALCQLSLTLQFTVV